MLAAGTTLAPFEHSSLVVAPQGPGRCVRTTAPIAAGTVLLVERAVVVAPEDALPAKTLETLSKRVVPTLEVRRSLIKAMWDGRNLPHLPSVSLSTYAKTGATPAHKALPLSRMRSIVRLNAFRVGTSWEEYAFGANVRTRPAKPLFGLFPLAALLNHSCIPNVSKVMHSVDTAEWIVMRAARDLDAGEECSHYYVRVPWGRAPPVRLTPTAPGGPPDATRSPKARAVGIVRV